MLMPTHRPRGGAAAAAATEEDADSLREFLACCGGEDMDAADRGASADREDSGGSRRSEHGAGDDSGASDNGPPLQPARSANGAAPKPADAAPAPPMTSAPAAAAPAASADAALAAAAPVATAGAVARKKTRGPATLNASDFKARYATEVLATVAAQWLHSVRLHHVSCALCQTMCCVRLQAASGTTKVQGKKVQHRSSVLCAGSSPFCA